MSVIWTWLKWSTKNAVYCTFNRAWYDLRNFRSKVHIKGTKVLTFVLGNENSMELSFPRTKIAVWNIRSQERMCRGMKSPVTNRGRWCSPAPSFQFGPALRQCIIQISVYCFHFPLDHCFQKTWPRPWPRQLMNSLTSLFSNDFLKENRTLIQLIPSIYNPARKKIL